MKQQQQAKTKPVAEVRYGNVRAAIWRNESQESSWFNVTFERSYRDEDEFKSSQSFGRDDLLLLAKVANEAHTLVYDMQREERLSQE